MQTYTRLRKTRRTTLLVSPSLSIGRLEEVA